MLQSASKMAHDMHEENKHDDIFDLSVDQITQRLEDIHESLFDTNAFTNLNYNHLQTSTNNLDNSFSSPSKSTALSSNISSKSAANSSTQSYNYTSPNKGKKKYNPMYDIDNMSVLSQNSFMSNSSNFSQNSNYTMYPNNMQTQ